MTSFVCVLAVACIGYGAAVSSGSLHEAITAGDRAQVSGLIEGGADLNAPDAEGWTPLGRAIVGGNPGICEALLQAGANASASSPEGTPLYLAARAGMLDVVAALLLNRGVEINASDGTGATALHAAAAMGHTAIIESLLGAGADANARTRAGLTPLDLALLMQRTQAAAQLNQMEAGAQQGGRGQRATRGEGEPGARQGGRGRRGMQTDIADSGEAVTPQNWGRPGVSTEASAYGNTMARATVAMAQPAAEPQQPSTPDEILADPNAIRQRIASFAGLAESLATLEESSRAEQRGWQQRQVDNRTSLVRIADSQFNEELAVVRSTAEKESAAQTVQAIDELAAKRQERYDAIAEVLREQRRAAVLAEREATRSARGTAARGRGWAATDTAVAAAPVPMYGVAATRDPNAPPVDPDTEAQLRGWESASTDKRTLLDTVLDTDLRELNTLRQAAVAESANETVAAIEGLMLARVGRRDAVLERIAADEERQLRLEERAGARTRGGAIQEGAAAPGGRRLR